MRKNYNLLFFVLLLSLSFSLFAENKESVKKQTTKKVAVQKQLEKRVEKKELTTKKEKKKIVKPKTEEKSSQKILTQKPTKKSENPNIAKNLKPKKEENIVKKKPETSKIDKKQQSNIENFTKPTKKGISNIKPVTKTKQTEETKNLTPQKEENKTTATQTNSEIEEPWDKKHNVKIITTYINQRLHLFPFINNFVSARLIKKGNTYQAKVLFSKSTFIQKEISLDLSKDELSEIRGKIDTFFSQKSLTQKKKQNIAIIPSIQKNNQYANYDEKENKDGQLLLMTHSATLGIFYGWILPSVFREKPEDSVVLGSITFFTATGGILPYILTDSKKVTMAMDELAWTGGFRGFADALALDLLISTKDYDNSFEKERLFPISLISLSVGEYLGGYYIAKNTKMTAGTAQLLSSTSILGYTAGLFSALLFQEGSKQKTGATLLTGGLAGLGLGYALNKTSHYTAGDARLVLDFSLVSLGLGMSFLSETKTAGNESTFGIVGLTSLATGCLVANLALKETDFSLSESFYIDLMGLAGAGTVSGLLALVGTRISSKAYVTSLALGGTTGYIIGYALFYNSAQARFKTYTKEKQSNFSFQFNPAGVLALTQHTKAEHFKNVAQTEKFLKEYQSSSIVSFSYKF